MHKTTTIHSEIGNNWVMEIENYPDKWRIKVNVNGKEEVVFIDKKNEEITHTTGEK